MPKPKILFLSGQEIFNELDKKRYFEASSSSVHTQYAFILKVNEQYTENQLEQIKNILNATDLNISPSLIFSPRLGTKSSWSSKCEDIFRNIGLKSIDRIERLKVFAGNENALKSAKENIFDRMTESAFEDFESVKEIFSITPRKKLQIFNIHTDPQLLENLNNELSLALNSFEINYLMDLFKKLDRGITDAELMMFSQINSEHCRHKIFRSTWQTDLPFSYDSLFDGIKSTTKDSMEHVLSAYHDNSAVIKSNSKSFLEVGGDLKYKFFKQDVHTTIKVETHNHPTGISPFEGSATGSGGEIRDCSATGRVARPKAGFIGLTLSHLRLGNELEEWESPLDKPSYLSSPKDIILDAPIGAAAYNNEFGRPAIYGYFRTLEHEKLGFHKPIMLAGGVGSIKEIHIEKGQPEPDDLVIVLGGPSMLIGLGGGSASSVKGGSSSSDLDFASVQRSNPEMQRRAQQVLDRFNARNAKNPISFIHDVGAGGISNAIPELAKDTNLGVAIQLKNIFSEDDTLSPMEIWSNESQERYVFSIPEKKLKVLEDICKRERCPYSVAGKMTEQKTIDVKWENEQVVLLDIDDLFGEIPLPKLIAQDYDRTTEQEELPENNIGKLIANVLKYPAVASKDFLITIGDRTVNGLVYRDQLIGNRQVPVSDYAITLDDYHAYSGQVFAIGEKPNISIENPEASVRMCMAEALTNIIGVKHDSLKNIVFSANWMSSSKTSDERGDLLRGVQAISNLANELGVSIPVGKDSLSMNVNWEENGEEKSITSPMTLNLSAFSNVPDVRESVTPELSEEDSHLLHVWINETSNRMGGSALYQSYGLYGGVTPDVDNTKRLERLFNSIQKLLGKKQILATHDVSDGGLIVTLLEMAFCSNKGLDISLNESDKDLLVPRLFAEEVGVVIEVKSEDLKDVKEYLAKKDLYFNEVAKKNEKKEINITNFNDEIFSDKIENLFELWSEMSNSIKTIRDNPVTTSEQIATYKKEDIFLNPQINFDVPKVSSRIFSSRPKVALLREQGINGHYDMAAALMASGFEVRDVHMSELGTKVKNFDDCSGLVVPGGFSYGDVLGAGSGMSNTIMHNAKLKKIFKNFFENEDKFVLGVCNGCQFLSGLKDIIPGASNWPKFEKNLSNQYECRLVQIKIAESRSIFFKDMQNSVIPIMVSHGEGRVGVNVNENVIGNYVDSSHNIAEKYPLNPNGSKNGIAGVCNEDGRITIMMPHPERTFMTKQFSWAPNDWDEHSPWFKMFDNAYKFSKN